MFSYCSEYWLYRIANFHTVIVSEKKESVLVIKIMVNTCVKSVSLIYVHHDEIVCGQMTVWKWNSVSSVA